MTTIPLRLASEVSFCLRAAETFFGGVSFVEFVVDISADVEVLVAAGFDGAVYTLESILLSFDDVTNAT